MGVLKGKPRLRLREVTPDEAGHYPFVLTAWRCTGRDPNGRPFGKQIPVVPVFVDIFSGEEVPAECFILDERSDAA